MKVFGLVALALVMIITVIMIGYAYQAVDYEASNKTGDMTNTTNQTITSYQIQYAWWGGVALLIFIIAVGMALWKFFG
jgi:heme/copper-type cytochrome/quinol oxidase subunit 2